LQAPLAPPSGHRRRGRERRPWRVALHDCDLISRKSLHRRVSDRGDNPFRAHHIRNSISLTITRPRRIISTIALDCEQRSGKVFLQTTAPNDWLRCALGAGRARRSHAASRSGRCRLTRITKRRSIAAVCCVQELAAAIAAPIGAFGAQAFSLRGVAPAIDFSQFPICEASSDARPIGRRAAQAETLLERRRGVPCASARRHRLRFLPETESRRRTRQTTAVLTDQLLEAHRHRQERRRTRHGAALAQAAGAGD